ncbi:hypothetical protein LA080_013131 [Diaporthe eres]|nr:hypothetical protein LA080_013131 [Diaporthe eres]
MEAATKTLGKQTRTPHCKAVCKNAPAVACPGRLIRARVVPARPSSSGGILSFYAVHTSTRQTAASGNITYHTGLQKGVQERLLRHVCLICSDLRLSVSVCSCCVCSAYFGPSTHPAYRTSELWQELNGQQFVPQAQQCLISPSCLFPEEASLPFSQHSGAVGEANHLKAGGASLSMINLA